MLNNAKHEPEGLLTPLLAEIVNDSQMLIREEIALAKSEISKEAKKLKFVILPIVLALVSAIAGIMLVAQALVASLSEILPNMSLWQCTLAVALVFVGLTTVFLCWAKFVVTSIDFSLPITRASLKEITNV